MSVYMFVYSAGFTILKLQEIVSNNLTLAVSS